MADNLTHIDVDSDEYDDAPKALRDYVKKLQKQNESLSTELDGVRGREASRAVSDVLADKGFKNPKRVERDLLGDSIDPLDIGAVEAWLAENSGDYAQTEAVSESVDPGSEQDADAQRQAQLNSLNVEPGGGLTKLEQVQASLPDNPTSEQVREAYLKAGV